VLFLGTELGGSSAFIARALREFEVESARRVTVKWGGAGWIYFVDSLPSSEAAKYKPGGAFGRARPRRDRP
jgi:hypothetical protein